MAKVVNINQGSSDRLKSCVPAIAWLLLAAGIVSTVVGYFGVAWYGSAGLSAAVIAGSLCFISAAAALVVTVFTAGTPNAVSGLLLGIFLRTAVPFLVSIFVVRASKPLADAGLLGMVLINYFVVLAVETVLAARLVQANSSTVVRR